MARRVSKIEMTMFPFLSVLCSVIGVLVLFIVLVLSTRVVIEDEKYQVAQSELRTPRPGRVGALEEGIESPTYQALEAELKRLAALVAERKEQRDTLVERLAGLEDLIEYKKTELFIPARVTRPTEFDKPEPIAMVPSQGVKVDLRPIFIEVSQSGYTVHPQKTHFPVMRSEEDPLDPELAKLLQQISARKKKEYVVFLIHPNGVAAFQALSSVLLVKYPDVQLGWEPFAREWVLSQDST